MNLSDFPWQNTLNTLRTRFSNDHLALTASSLTFTTTIALVPFITVALAVFTAFPVFSTVQAVLQKWLIESLVPDAIARQVMAYLTQFSGRASKLGVVGAAVLLATALALILTIDQTLNGIWRVRKRRPLRQRVLIYWAGITLGPVLLGASLTMTSYAISSGKGLVGALPGGVQFFFAVLEYFLLAAAMAALYRFVPNTHVKWAHAWSGGLFVATGIVLAKKLLVIYIGLMPTYSVVYGAFAIVPILLVWIYVAWVIVLLGAVVTAYLPSLLAGVARKPYPHGWQFQLAVEILQRLHNARINFINGMTMVQIADALQVDTLQIEPVLEALAQIDWVAQLDELEPGLAPRHVLLVDPLITPLAPLMAKLLLPQVISTEKLWRNGQWSTLNISHVL